MMPRLGEKYDIEIETISKPPKEYQSEAYSKLSLPVAPAITVGGEKIVEGSGISEDKLEAVICGYLGLTPPEPQRKGSLSRFLKR